MRRADLARLKAAARAVPALMSALALAATPALAQQWGGGRDGGRDGGRWGGFRQDAAYQERGGGWRARGGGRGFEGNGARRGDGQGRGSAGDRGYGGYGAPAYGQRRGNDGGYGGGYAQPGPAAGGRAWRRGEVLPNGYRGANVADPGRYHLRRPPNGYDWVGDNRNAYLMQRSTGMVLDSVPGAYDAPPPYRGRRR